MGEQVTLWSIDGALVAYVVALAAVMMARGAREEGKHAALERWARLFWTMGCGLLWLHMACVFQFYHDWSHANAVKHTARETAAVVGIDWGGGVWFNYAFAAVWTADALWWCLAPLSYRNRSPWISGLIHVYLAFIIFNATVVFKTGPLRWAGIVAVAFLSLLWIRGTLLTRAARDELARRESLG